MLLFILLPFAGFYLGVRYQQFISPKIQQYNTIQITKPTPTPPPAGGPTANWKTYTSNKIGYIQKYPKTMVPLPQAQGNFVSFQLIKQGYYIPGDFTYNIGSYPINQKDNLFHSSTDIAYNSQKYQSIKIGEKTIIGNNTGWSTRLPDVVVDRSIGTVFEQKGIGGIYPNVKLRYIVIKGNKFIFVIDSTYTTIAELNLFNSLLSTFKFTDNANTELDQIINLTRKEITWQKDSTETAQIIDGETVTGVSKNGSVITQEPSKYLSSIEDAKGLKKLGWNRDISFDGMGPDGFAWRYTKIANGKKQILYFSSQNQSLRPAAQGGLESQCPCTIKLTIFLSDPF